MNITTEKMLEVANNLDSPFRSLDDFEEAADILRTIAEQQRDAAEVTSPDPKAWFDENDEAIATLVYQKLGEELGDKLTFERSPSMFPQATYSLCRAAVRNFIVSILGKYRGHE